MARVNRIGHGEMDLSLFSPFFQWIIIPAGDIRSRSEKRLFRSLSRVVPQPVSRALDSVIYDRVKAIGIWGKRGYGLNYAKGGSTG